MGEVAREANTPTVAYQKVERNKTKIKHQDVSETNQKKTGKRGTKSSSHEMKMKERTVDGKDPER